MITYLSMSIARATFFNCDLIAYSLVITKVMRYGGRWQWQGARSAAIRHILSIACIIAATLMKNE
jgi:hypothetical protein